jgi:glutamyl-tRNA synthetase
MHLSVFLKPSGKGKMSKRETAEAMKDGYSIFVKDMHELGFTPEGLLNWAALMGWGAGETEDVLTLNQMIEKFDVKRLTPSPAAINFAKLDYFNGEHIRRLTNQDLAGRIKPYFIQAGLPVEDARLAQIIPIIRERLVTLDDCLSFAAWFFKDSVEVNPAELVAKNLSAAQSAEVARKTYTLLESLPDLSHAVVEPPMRQLITDLGLSPNQVFGILRVALTGQMVSPPLFESMEIVGKDKVLERLRQAIELLENMN